MYYCQVTSPYGLLTLATDGTAITALHLEGDRYFKEIPADWRYSETQPVLIQALQQLRSYFKGELDHFTLPIQAAGTIFQRGVWQALQQIPAGQTSTYQTIATAIGKQKAVRAVGTAIGHNPICIIIPCHRVIASNGSLGGYVAGLDIKQQLLEFEASAFAKNQAPLQ